MKIRVVKTASNAKAVQVVRYQKNKRIIMKHIGSSHTKEGVDELKLLAQEWIKSYSSQLSLFPDENPNKLLHLNYCTFLGVIDKTITRKDGENIRLETEKGYLICSFSSVRYRKDLYEMNKQIDNAKKVIENPSKNKKTKFVKTKNQKIELNEKLIDKNKKLLGIKGYYTNLEESVIDNKTVIERYHELYKIEQAFRISKSDLQTRPIFHFKEQPIKLHILICFIALVVSKHIELQTGISIKKFIDHSKKIVDGQILNTITNKIVTVKAKPTEEMKEVLQKLFPPH